MGQKVIKGADVMEGGDKIKNNSGYASARENLIRTYNPEKHRRMDTVAMKFLDHHVFAPVLAPVLNEKGQPTGEMQPTGQVELRWPAGCHMSPVELADAKYLEDTYPDLQERTNELVAEAGYATETVEPEGEGQVIA